jgi:hypothetical protein
MTAPAPVITGDEILATNSADQFTVQNVTGLQRAGLLVALSIGIFSTFAIIWILWVWSATVPPPPALVVNSANAPTAISDTVQTLANYRVAAEVAAEKPLQWFDVLFTKMIYPLLTLVLGYIFASRENNASREV